VNVRIPVQRIYMHPLTLGNILRKDIPEDLQVANVDPLTEDMKQSLYEYEKLSGLTLH